jgi:hypothetical protein
LEQEKAKVHEQLHQKMGEILEMHKEVEQKSEEVAEKVKQIEALLVQHQLNESIRFLILCDKSCNNEGTNNSGMGIVIFMELH